LLGVVCADEDDDGEKAVSRDEKEDVNKITPEQLEQLYYELQGEENLTESILKVFKIKQLSEMPRDKFLSVISRIREVKNNQK